MQICCVRIGRDGKRYGGCMPRRIRRSNVTATFDGRSWAHGSEEPLTRVQLDLRRRAQRKRKNVGRRMEIGPCLQTPLAHDPADAIPRETARPRQRSIGRGRRSHGPCRRRQPPERRGGAPALHRGHGLPQRLHRVGVRRDRRYLHPTAAAVLGFRFARVGELQSLRALLEGAGLHAQLPVRPLPPLPRRRVAAEEDLCLSEGHTRWASLG